MKKFFLILPLMMLSFPAIGQNIEIDADNRIEWHRNEQKMIAVGNAVAVQENDILKGDTLTAFYERVQFEDGTQKNQIQKILAEGKVSIQMDESIGTGNHFTYDLPTQISTLKGKPAQLTNKMGVITAKNSIVYYGAENKSVATGDVIAKSPEYTVYSDKMISYFTMNKQGQRELKKVDIFADNRPVKIINQQAEVTGKKGSYFPLENKFKIFDDVVIKQNGDILNGDYAETDLNTGISRLLPTKKGGRVSGIFHNKKK